MSNQSRLMNYSEAGVLNIRSEGNKKLFSHPTHLVSALSSNLKAALLGSGHLSSDECQQLFDEGVDCEFLEVGSAWQIGKIRVCLQFVAAQEEKLLEESAALSEASIDSSEPDSSEPDSSELPIDSSEPSLDFSELSLDSSEASIDLSELSIDPSETVELPLDEVWQTLSDTHAFTN